MKTSFNYTNAELANDIEEYAKNCYNKDIEWDVDVTTDTDGNITIKATASLSRHAKSTVTEHFLAGEIKVFGFVYKDAGDIKIKFYNWIIDKLPLYDAAVDAEELYANEDDDYDDRWDDKDEE